MDMSKYLFSEGEKPLDRIVDDGGYTAIFRTIGCIGDSLSSGEHESTDPLMTKKGYHDYYAYSWGQYMARAAGCQVYNFSRSGMTAFEYWDSFAEKYDYWNQAKLCQAYIIALGVNDVINKGLDIGTTADIDMENPDNNAKNFCGYYARIIQRLRTAQPDAKFFLVSMPDEGYQTEKRKRHAELLYELAELFGNTYVIDLFKYAPPYDGEFKKVFFLGGHMNAMGYLLTAKMIMSYIDWIIRQNPEDFLQVAFIGKGTHNYTAKF